ncbi:MAG: peptidoglycan-binding protein [Halomonas sp.]|uniref:peptidoglycan-binding protein n=1 Tax=Halomonas sp. TaxID=1486246 RepID=UPI0018029C9D|nr:peptidoglycan-binding protein [Halomonas sp.]NWN83146.1 peptidoglycan-binding protein [Halomonas sp.]
MRQRSGGRGRRFGSGLVLALAMVLATDAQSRGVIKPSPEMRTIPHREAVAPIPLENIRHFLRVHRVVDDPEALEGLAYVVGGDDRRLMSSMGDRLYARGNVPGNGRVGFYREGERFLDPTSGEPLGLELKSVGQARRESRRGEMTVLEVISSSQEVRSGDIVLPLENTGLVTEFVPRAPEREIEGTILALPGGMQFIGRLQAVALDRGRRDGLEAGHVLMVEQRGERVKDPRTGEPLRLPDEDAGLIMVVKPYRKMSYGLVMEASRSLSVGDRIRNPRRALGAARR